MKYLCLALFLFLGIFTNAQVGINTTTPKAQLDVQSSNQALPSNTDGILIPKVDVFPAINPTIAQQGMLVYLTTATTFLGNPKPIGFYYWNNSPADWIAVKGTDGGTLDQAYDFGGAGLGKTITADAGAVLINGTDGLVSTGTSGSGALAPSGAGTRMVWNPRKAAFRVGTAFGTQWDDANIGGSSVAFSNATASGTNSFAVGSNSSATGFNSVAFGTNVLASGNFSIAFGASATASGSQSFAFGTNAIASGSQSTSFGGGTLASGFQSTTFGGVTTAIGTRSTSLGDFNTASSYGETVLGIGATIYTPSTNGDTQFRNANATDRLFVIGNTIDANNNNTVDLAERSDAMVILKNGATGIGTSLPNALLDVNATDNGILIPRVALTSLLVQAPIVNPQGGVLPTSTMVYNTATAGVSPNNVFPGFYYWSTSRWARFDVGGENNPTYYTAVGTFNAISFTSFSSLSQMSVTFTPKDDVAMVHFSAAGHRQDDSCANTAIFFQIVLNGVPVTGWQTSAKQAIVDTGGLFDDDVTTWDTNFSYPITVTIGTPQTIQIQWASPDCLMSNNPGTPFSAFGSVFKSYRSLTVIDPNGGGGIIGTLPVTTNVWAHNGNTGTNALVNFVGTADSQPLLLKSNNLEGLRVATNGRIGMGSITPLEKLHLSGKAFFENGFTTDNAALVYRNNTDYMFLGPQSGSSANGGAMALYGSTNVSSGNAGGIDFNVISGLVRLTAAGRVGIGTPTPSGQLELSLDQGIKPGTFTWTLASDRRLKTINGNYTKGLNEILQLNPILFNYKNNGKRKFEQKVLDTEFPGFIAQEVQPIFPDAIGTDEDGFLNFNIHPILIASINAFKELNQKNEQLQLENEALKTQLEVQKNKITTILQRLENLETK